MSDGNTRRNRHGIPVGDEPGKCVWPRCAKAAARWLQVPLCQDHAELTYDSIDAFYERQRRIVQASLDAANERTAQLDAEWQERRAAERERNQVIYYLQVGGHIKIGWTSQLEQRMRNYPPNTLLLAVHRGTRADERQLHRRFAVHRSHGHEWYPLVPVILDHIKRVLAEHGQPPAMTFGARPVEVLRPKAKPHLQAKYGPNLIA